jgi:enoyl-CoA hydratase/carnithine racemase
MAADIRVTHDAAKLGLTFVGLGLHPGMGCTHTVAAATNHQVANRMLLTGDVVSGSEAAALGLVVASLPDQEQAMQEALSLARRIAAQSPLAVRASMSEPPQASHLSTRQRVVMRTSASPLSVIARPLLCSQRCAPSEGRLTWDSMLRSSARLTHRLRAMHRQTMLRALAR